MLRFYNLLAFIEDRLFGRRAPAAPRPAQERKVLAITLNIADSNQSIANDESDIAPPEGGLGMGSDVTHLTIISELERPLLAPRAPDIGMTTLGAVTPIPESEAPRASVEASSTPGSASSSEGPRLSTGAPALAHPGLDPVSPPPGLELMASRTLGDLPSDVEESKFLSAVIRGLMRRPYDPSEPAALPKVPSDLPLRRLHPGLEETALMILSGDCRLSQSEAVKTINAFKALGYIESGLNYRDYGTAVLPTGADQPGLAPKTFVELCFNTALSLRAKRQSEAINYALVDSFFEQNLYPYLYLHQSAEVRSAGQDRVNRPPVGENGGLSPYSPSHENNWRQGLRRVLGIGSRAEHNYGNQSPFPEGYTPRGYSGLPDFSRWPSLSPVTVDYRQGVGPVIRTTRYVRLTHRSDPLTSYNIRLNQYYPGSGGVEFPVTNGILQMLVFKWPPLDRSCISVDAAILRTLPDQKGNPTSLCPEIMIPSTQEALYVGRQAMHYFKQIGVKIDGTTYTRFLRVNIKVPNRAYNRADLHNLSRMQILLNLDTAPELRQRWQAMRLRQPLPTAGPMHPYRPFNITYVFPHLHSPENIRPCRAPISTRLTPALTRGVMTLITVYWRYVLVPIRACLVKTHVYCCLRRLENPDEVNRLLSLVQEVYRVEMQEYHRYHNPPTPEQDQYEYWPL